jgi:hypothetical protein
MQQQTNQMPNWNQMMAGWSALANPTRCPVCGGAHAQAQTAAAPTTDWLSQWSEMPVVREWSRMWGGMLDPWVQGAKPPAGQQRQHRPHQQGHEQHHAKHRHDNCCGGCASCDCGSCCRADDCHCRCCVVNADLLVYARLGETRVVPVTIENNIRREREVEVDLSDWTTNGRQAVSVEARVEPDTKFTLRPCEERTVLIRVRVAPGAIQRNTDKANPGERAGAGVTQSPPASDAGDFRIEPDRERLPDVDNCTVFYADLRVKGCDIRPVRIALAVMPRDCDAYKIDCQCGCCC